MKKVKDPKKKSKKKIVIAIVLIVIIVIVGIACSMQGTAASIVNTTHATQGTISQTISTSGTVESEHTQVIFAPVSGKLAEVQVEAGDTVEAGATLITYDMESMERSLTQAKLQADASTSTYNGTIANSNESQSKLKEASANLTVLKQQIADEEAYIKALQNKLSTLQTDTSNGLAYERYNLNQKLSTLTNELEGIAKTDTAALAAKQQEIAEVNAAISTNTYVTSIVETSTAVVDLQKKIEEEQDKLQDYQTYKTEMEQQKSTNEATVLDSYQKSTQSANQQLNDMTYESAEDSYQRAKDGVVAEFPAIVTDVTVVNGATVAEGTQMMTLADTEQIKVTISVTKYDLAKLLVGQMVDVTISDHTYQGSVAKINRMATVNATGAAAVGAEIHIENPDDLIYLGIEAKVVIHTAESENAVLLPIEAVNADNEGDFVYVVEQGIVVRKSVTTGIQSDMYLEILNGITIEDEVVLSSYTDITEGMSVTAIAAE